MPYGATIKRFRKSRNLTQAEFGLLVGKKQNQISEWEKGKIIPSPTDVLNICKALDITPSQFYGLENKYDIAIEYAKDKGLTPEDAIKALELYMIYKDR